MTLYFLLTNKITYTEKYLPTEAVRDVGSHACHWQGCAKPEAIFPNSFNQIHRSLFLNVTLKLAKKPSNMWYGYWLDLFFKMITKKCAFLLLNLKVFSGLKLIMQQKI